MYNEQLAGSGALGASSKLIIFSEINSHNLNH